MNYSDEDILKRAHELKPHVSNPFNSFWFTMLMLFIYPLYFVRYEWEIYTADSHAPESYSQACIRWQNISIWWSVAILFLLFENFEPMIGHSAALIIKVCLMVAFSMYIFVVFVFGFMIDTIATRYKESLVKFALKYKFIMGVTVPAVALATITLTAATIVFVYGAYFKSDPLIFYCSLMLVLGAQISWFACYAIFIKDSWVPIEKACIDLKIIDEK